MAIQLSSAIITSQNFVLQNRTLKATYTPEIDEKFSDLMVDLEDMQAKLESKETSNLPVAEKKKLNRKVSADMVQKTEKYIRALFNDNDATFIIEQCGGRAINLARMAGTFFNAGNEGEQKNRKQRRSENN